MTLNELKKKVDKAIKLNGGKSNVYFDSEAATFITHLVSMDNAHYMNEKQSGADEKLFVLTTSDLRVYGD